MSATALATDLYQLTMMAGYFVTGRHETSTATFELFVRRLPARRSFLITAGLESFVEFLERLEFDDEEVERLRDEPGLRGVPPTFFEYLRGLRFTGDVWGVPEGTPVFANEPLLRVTAPIGEAQLVETSALAFINFQTSIASKAARIVNAADGHPVYEFGARRAHGLEAALFAARAGFVAGCAGTSFVEAGLRFGIPLSGTMAHSWVLSSADEIGAFRTYDALFGEHAVLLLDTYDTIAAARAVVASGLRPAGVRLDSGDLVELSRGVRGILDAGWSRANAHHRERRPRRVEHPPSAGCEGANRCLRCGNQPGHVERCSGAGRGLQARGNRRAGPGPACQEDEPRQSDMAW